MGDAESQVRLDRFRPSVDRGVSRRTEALWYVTKVLFFLPAWRWPSVFKADLLRRFGATVGRGVVIAPRVNIHMPWKLTVGDHAWIGEEVFVLNLEPITIGSHVVISQRAFLCTGNHDYSSPTFDYMGATITIGDGAWIGALAFIGPGVTVGIDTVATAGSVVLKDLPDGQVCSGNPCEPVRPRSIRTAP